MCRKADNPWLLSDNDFVFTSFTEMYVHVLLISKYKYEFLVLLLFNFYLTQKTKTLEIKNLFYKSVLAKKDSSIIMSCIN